MAEMNNIMFIDVRGFTSWFNKVGLANISANPLLSNLYKQIQPNFRYTKFLGDGAMVLCTGKTTEEGSKEDLLNILDITTKIKLEFDEEKRKVSEGFAV